MKRSSSPTRHVRSFAEETGMSDETVEFAIDMARTASRSEYANDWLPKGIAAGCLYAASIVVNSSGDSGSSSGGSHSDASSNATPERPANWNTQIGHRRSDRTSTEMKICQVGSITPASTRRYAQDIAALYLECPTTTLESRTRNRLARLASR